MDRKTILVADDEPHMALMLQFLFQDEDFTFLKADNGDDAIEIAKLYNPDLILLDCMMPKSSKDPTNIVNDEGIKVCRTLKGNNKTNQIPIAILSAIGETQSRIAIDAGAIKCFSKAYDDIEMYEWVTNFLGGNKPN